MQIKSMLDRLRDIGQPSLGLAGAMLLLVLILLLLGIRNPGASTWCRRLLSISAALAYAINLIIASSYCSMLFEFTCRVELTRQRWAADHAMIEYHTILFMWLSALALVAAAVLVVSGGNPRPSTPTLTPHITIAPRSISPSMSSHKQQTLAGSASLAVQPRCTLAKVTLTMKPAPANNGIIFRRIDLDDQPFIPACVGNVQKVERATTLAVGSVKVLIRSR